MARLAQLRNYLLHAGIGTGLAVVAGWFYLDWLPSQQKYLDARNFRLLMTLSDQIGASITNLDKMMDNSADNGFEADHVHDTARSLQTLDKEDGENIDIEYHDPPRIMARADEGSHFLYFAYRRQVNKPAKQYVLRTDLDKLIRNLLPPADRNPFAGRTSAMGCVEFLRGTIQARHDIHLFFTAGGSQSISHSHT